MEFQASFLKMVHLEDSASAGLELRKGKGESTERMLFLRWLIFLWYLTGAWHIVGAREIFVGPNSWDQRGDTGEGFSWFHS